MEKSWTSGVTTTVSTTDLRDIVYDNSLYVVSDEKGGITTSSNAVTWERKTPTWTDSNQVNGTAYGDNVWVGVGSDANVGYSTDNTANWETGSVFSYVFLNFGRYSFTSSSTTRKIHLLHMVMISLLLLEVVQAYSSQTMSIPTIQTG